MSGLYILRVPPGIKRAQGMPGAQRTRSLVCKEKHTSYSPQVRRTIRHSLHDGLTAYFRALLGEPGFVATVACGFIIRKLDASVGASGPHGFAVRFSALRLARFGVHRIPRQH